MKEEVNVFYYVVKKETRRQKYGGYNITVSIFKVDICKCEPVFYGNVKYCTASCVGKEEEIEDYIKNKEGPSPEGITRNNILYDLNQIETRG